MSRAQAIKTDNANINHKVALRREATQDLNEIRVLDLFAGKNVLWSHFDCAKYYGIEAVKGKGKNLNAKNEKVIASLDLSRFNVIDCDSYGIPIKQLELIFANDTLQDGTIILYTAIGNGLTELSKLAIMEFGFQDMYKKCKSLFNGMSLELFHAWLYNRGVRTVREYEEPSAQFKKKYGWFKVKK